MSSLDEISRAIGALQAQNEMILEAQGKHNEETKAIQADLTSLKTDMAAVKADVAAFRPAAKKVEKWEQRAVGMSVLSGLVGGFIWGHFKGWFG